MKHSSIQEQLQPLCNLSTNLRAHNFSKWLIATSPSSCNHARASTIIHCRCCRCCCCCSALEVEALCCCCRGKSLLAFVHLSPSPTNGNSPSLLASLPVLLLLLAWCHDDGVCFAFLAMFLVVDVLWCSMCPYGFFAVLSWGWMENCIHK